MNTLISIGWIGVKSCYLNISLEEAKLRYIKDNPEEKDCLDRDGFVESFKFNDEFGAYSVWDIEESLIDHIRSDGKDPSGNEYELLSIDEEADNLIINGNPGAAPPEGIIDTSADSSIESQDWSTSKPIDEDDVVTSLLESRAKDLSYAFAQNPKVFSSKLKESLVSIAGPEASKAYHISAYYDGKEINFSIARLSPSFIVKLETDFNTIDLGAAYYNTFNGWVVSAGLSVSAGLGFNSPDDSDIKAQFTITISK